MAQDRGCPCRLLRDIACVAVALLFVSPVIGQGTSNGGQPHGLDPSFIRDPFHDPNANPAPHSPHLPPGAPSPADFPPAYHKLAGTGANSNTTLQPHPNQNQYNPNQGGQYSSQHYPGSNQYAYNPAPNQYQYNSHSNQAAGSYQYPTTASPPVTAPVQSPGGEEEYEMEDGRPGASGATGAHPQPYVPARAPAQHHWYYGNYGAGQTGAYRSGGLLEALRPQPYYHQQQPPAQSNPFNNPLFYLALSGWW